MQANQDMSTGFGRPTVLTEEGTGGEDGSDEGLLGGRDHVTGRMNDEIGGWLSEETKPVLHRGDTRDGTGVITEQDTTKGGEGDHENTSYLALGGIGTNAAAGYCWTTCHCRDEGLVKWTRKDEVG